MIYLLDSDRLISYLNGRPIERTLVPTLIRAGLAISVITYGETREGLLSRGSGPRRRAALEEFVDSVDVLDCTFTIARQYAELRSRLRATGQLLADNDLWIAATALMHDLTLVSGDQHFARVPDLKRYTEEPA